MHIKTSDIVEEVIIIVENQLQSLSENQKLTLRSWLEAAIDHHIEVILEEEHTRLYETLTGNFPEFVTSQIS